MLEVESLMKAGGEDLVGELRSLLAALEAPLTSAGACRILHQLAQEVARNGPQSAQLKLHSLHAPGLSRPLKIFVHPAVFTPELWGRTFAEGLLKEPEVFHHKRVIEVGTGAGWIGLLLLMRTGALSVFGVDINPVAILLANLNKWLNGTSPEGSLILSEAGVPVVEAFTAEVSDLLSVPLLRGQRCDHVVGCIPQVLHPDPGVLESRTRFSDQDLYDLSNYCFNQGILEDRFGLPLIARALEESQLCLNSHGLVTLILGGRPGRGAIEEMFRRRGFTPELFWSRRIQQADDTDLAQLVELEKSFDIRFHFFLAETSQHSVPASTAVRLQSQGHDIYHDLLVYRALTQFERPTLSFLRNLHRLGLTSLRKELDFSRISEEQISFLDRLTTELLTRRALPYPHERGDLSLREKLASFLSVYCHRGTKPDDLFIGPARNQLFSMVLSMIAKRGSRVLLSSSLVDLYGPAARAAGLEVITANDDLGEILELENIFNPSVSIIAPRDLANPSSLLVSTIVERARSQPDRWYIFDDSHHFDIGSQMQANLLLRLLGQVSLPPNLVFLYGLIKNVVCPDFELSFLVNAPQTWLRGLEVCTEVTYSRISFVAQLYYEWLFEDLLSFPFDVSPPSLPAEAEGEPPDFSPEFSSVVNDPVFAQAPVDPQAQGVIRLDYGEFETAIPDLLVNGLIKGVLGSPLQELEATVAGRVAAYLLCTRRMTVQPGRIVLAQGVFPLFGALLTVLARRLGRKPLVAVPRGTYGPIFPMLAHHGALTMLIETSISSGFSPTLDDLRKLERTPDLLWITQPGNPSGIYMPASGVSSLLENCSERGIIVMSDESYFLLSDTAMGEWTPPELSAGCNSHSAYHHCLFYCDGLSKAFAAGGLRAGFLVCPDSGWASEIQNLCQIPPQSILRAWDTLYSAFLDEAPHQLMDIGKERSSLFTYLLSARNLLANHRGKLLQMLAEHEMDDRLGASARGGFFTLSGLSDRVSELATRCQLLINTDAWSRTPGWSRICFSLPPDRFDEALARLRDFLDDKI